MKRREFLVQATRAIPIVGASYYIACSSDSGVSPGPNPTPSPTPTSTPSTITATSTVQAGHTHNASVPRTDLISLNPKSYNTSVNIGHTHWVTLSAVEFRALMGGGVVTVASSVDGGHNHEFTFSG